MWCHLPTGFNRRLTLRVVALLSIFVALITTLVFNPVTNATAGINQTINFQGRLYDSTGGVVPDGYYNIQFKIYQDGDGQTAGDTTGSPAGSLKWTDSYINNGGTSGVLVKNGFLSVNLGSKTPFGTSIDWNQSNLWLSMNVAGSSASCTTFGTAPCAADGEMLPMKQMTASPYSLNSGKLGGLAASNFVQLAQGVQNDATGISSIFINKTGAGNLIQLQNTASDIFTVGNTGDITLGNNANHTISITTATSGAGKSLTMAAGNAASGSSLSGGNLVLQGGVGDGTAQSGSVVVKSNGTNSTTAFSIQDFTGSSLLNADTTNSIIQVGSATANTNQALLVLNNYSSATDPTNGTNGAMYYNTALNIFRCFNDGSWVNCARAGGVGGAGAANKVAFFNSAGNLQTNSQFAWNDTAGQLQVGTPAPAAYSVGSTGPAGGKIFYDKGNNSGGWQYLEAATADATSGAWGCSGTNVTTGLAVGTGNSNTSNIIGAGCSGSSNAAEIASSFSQGGFVDWFLPSRDELDQAVTSGVVAGMGAGWYQTSSQYSTASAYVENKVGTQTAGGKTTSYSVRPVREVSGLTSSGLFVDTSTDRVGIGTVAPGYNLEVDGTTGLSGNLSVFGNTAIKYGSTSAFNIQNATSVSLLNADTTNGILQVGSATANTNQNLLVLNNYSNATDPTNGTNGAMYYNTSTNTFRCFANGVWGACSGATGSFIQLAPTVVQADATANSSIFINKTGTGNLLELQNAGTDAFTVGNAGDLTLGNNANHTLSITTAVASTAGKSLTISSGNGGSGTGSIGGNLVLQGGSAGGTNANGGNVLISGGPGNGTGTYGNTILQSGGGNVGIGTSTPTSQLDVNGVLTVHNPSNGDPATISLTNPYYGRLNFSVTPENGKSEVRYVSKGATAGTGQTYFVIASTEAADTGNNLLMGVAAGRAFITNAVNYATAGTLDLGGTSWSSNGVLQLSGTSGSGGQAVVNGTLTYTDSGAAATSLVCKDGTGLLSTCSTTGTGAAFIQGGNNFGADAVLGTTQAGQQLTFKTGGTNRLTLDSTGSNLTFLQAANINTTGATALGMDTGGAAALNLGTIYANAINVGTANGAAINIGNVALASGIQNINIGNNAGAGTTNTVIGQGSQVAGSGAVTGGATAIQSKANTTITTNGVNVATFDTSSHLYVGNGIASGAPVSSYTIQGTSSAATGVTASGLSFYGGDATTGNANGGSLVFRGGLKSGTGSDGAVYINTTNSGTVQLGSSYIAGAQSVFVGYNNTAGSTDYVTMGNLLSTSTTLIQGGTGASAVGIQSGTGGTISVGTTNAGIINVGNTTAATTTLIQGGTGASAVGIQSGGGAISIGTTNGAAINVGDSTTAVAQTVNLGYNNTAGSTDNVNIGNLLSNSSTQIQGGTGVGAVGIQSGTGGTISVGTSSAGAVNINNSIASSVTFIQGGTGATAIGIQAGTGGTTSIATTNAGIINIGNATAATTTLIQGGTGASAVGIQMGTGGTTSIATTNAGIINIGNATAATTTLIQGGTGASAVGIQSGGGAINIGTNSAATINIGDASLASVIQNINIGNNVNTGSTNTVIGQGSQAAGAGVVTGGATAIQSKANTTITTNGITRAIFDTSGNLYVGNGATNVSPVGFTIQGTSSSATGISGGSLTVQGGGATTGNSQGGNLTLSGGVGSGTGASGLVILTTTSAQTVNDANCYNVAASCTISMVSLNSSSAILAGFTTAGQSATLPNPPILTAGRVVYITATNGSNDFTLIANSGGGAGIEQDIAMRQNTSATMVWNGNDWTAAGASSSTTLQSAYNNTLQSAGGAELVVSKTSSTNGLTIRDSTTNSVNGTLLQVQSKTAANLFSVSSNVSDYASDNGAETAGGSPSAFPANTWSNSGASASVNRYTTAGNYIATGQASVSVQTSTTANTGAKNQIVDPISGSNTTLNANTQYNVSFTTRLLSGTFTTLNVYYSVNGSAQSVQCMNSQAAQTSITSSWSKINCSFIAPTSGELTSNAILIQQSDATARTFYVDNLSVTIAAGQNYATDGGVDLATGTNWTSAGAGTVSVAQNTADGNDTSDSAKATISTNTAGAGLRNILSINPLTNTLYRVSIYAKLNSGAAFNDFKVRYSPNGGTSYVDCVDYNTQTVVTTGWTQITCYVSTAATAVTSPYVYFEQTGAPGGARTFSVDTFSMTLASSTTPDVQIGSGTNGGPVTLFTLDSSASAPIANNNTALFGSMYYDTTQGKIQCYQAAGWGACGASPDTIVTISPEYNNAVMHGTGVGTMVSDFCSGSLGINDGSAGQPTICGSGQTYNFYKWTSPQATNQAYSIYVTYQLPSTFKAFTSGQTSVVAQTDAGSLGGSATVTYTIYNNDTANGTLTVCGSAVTVATGTEAWNVGTAVGAADPSTCSFAAGSSIVFKIDMTANKNAIGYVSNLGFTYSNY